MPRVEKRLAAVALSKIKTPGWYPDGGGLYLRIKNSGTRQWVFRFRDGASRHEMGLGSFPKVTLAEAREKAEAYRKERRAGKNPLAMKQAEKAERRLKAASTMTFRQVGEACFQARRPEWKNPKHIWQWRASLETFVYPVFGDLPVQAIETSHVLKALEPIWLEKTETATRVRGRIEAVLNYATAHGHRIGENPARWRGHLDHLLPRSEKIAAVKHQPSMPYREIPAFMVLLRRETRTPAMALQFTILTAARSGEVLLCPWDEIDLDNALWTIPGKRMKGGKIHRVPLRPPAIEILHAMKANSNGNPYVFPGRKDRQPLSDQTMLKVLEKMGRDDVSVHGFRSSFRDWCAEQTSFPREVCEAALAHVNGDKTEAAYFRSDLLERRRELMQAWADHAFSAV
jgi:integrase